MEKNIVMQEILLLTNSSFSNSELCGDDLYNNKNGTPPSEKLEQACWNGLLNEWLPDTIKTGGQGEHLFIWKINVANKFLCIELSEAPSVADYYFSLDPYLFLPSQHIN